MHEYNIEITTVQLTLIARNICKAILKKMSVGGNISDKKVNRKEGNFYFFKEHFQYSANVVLTNIWFPEREHEIRQFQSQFKRNI